MSERLKIVIADDEAMVCVVIKDAIDYDRVGLNLVGIAYDGLTLLNIITEKRPDIVITDINMPGMNGIELIKEIRHRKIECKFIIISGYSQFDYARQAIKYKVDDYLLKPINETELNDVLIKLCNSILAEQEQQNITSKALEDQSKSKETLKRLFLYRIISEYDLPKDLDTISREYSLSFCDGIFQGAVIKLDFLVGNSEIQVGFESIQSKVINIFKQTVSTCCCETLYYFDNSILYLAVNYNSDHKKSVSDAFKNFFEYTKNLINLFDGMKITLGIGCHYNNVQNLKESLNEAIHALYYRITMGVDRVLSYDRLSLQSNHFDDDELKILLQRIQKDFEAIDLEDYQRCIQKIFSPVPPNPDELFSLSYKIEFLFLTLIII